MSVVAVVYGVNEALLKRSQSLHDGHVDEVILAKDDRTGLMNAWRRAAAAGLNAAVAGDWILLLQDDAVPSAPWLIRSALASCPTDAACLYTARKSHVALAEATGANWIDCQGAAWGVALAFERSALAEFVRWEREHVPDAYPHDDGRVSMWRIKIHKPYAIIAPSLYEHDARHSVLGHSNVMHGRKAAALDTRRSATFSPAPFPRAPNLLGKHTTRVLKEIR